MRTATIKDNNIYIKFKAQNKKEFQHLLSAVKKIPGRSFSPSQKEWVCPKSNEAITILDDNGFIIDGKKEKIIKPKIKRNIKPINPKGLKLKLWKYQKTGIGFIEQNNGRALIGDEQRVGKTFQALGWTHLHSEKKPILIICDASAKLVWYQAIKDLLPGKNKCQIIHGRKNHKISKKTKFIIVNYESVYQTKTCKVCNGKKTIFNNKPCSTCKGKGKQSFERADLKETNFQILIVDEAQKIKNISTHFTPIILDLSKRIPNVVATTGTPIENKPSEFYNIISLIDPKLFPKRWEFYKQYCNLHHNGFSWDYSGASNTQELYNILTSTIMIRRRREEVEKDTPKKVRPLVPIEFIPPNNSEYKRIKNELQEMGSDMNALQKYELLKQLAVEGKMQGVIQWIKEFLEESNRKLIVFAIHKRTIKLLKNHFKDIAVVLDGSTSSAIGKDGLNERKRVEIAFQTDPKIKLFIGNIQAASKAICLDAANDVAFVEFSFIPGHHLQAEDRPIHMRKKGQTIYAWYLIAQGTIEEDIFEVLDKKCKVLNQVLDGKDVNEKSVFAELLEKLKNKN